MKSVSRKVSEAHLWAIYNSHFDHFCLPERLNVFFKNEYLSTVNKRIYTLLLYYYESNNE